MILIIPDLFERSYVRELSNLLLVQMGFKHLCVQQVNDDKMPQSVLLTELYRNPSVRHMVLVFHMPA